MDPPRSPDTLQDSSPSPPDRLPLLAAFLGVRPDMPDLREYLVFLVASILVLIGTMSFLGFTVLAPYRQSFYQMLLQPEKLSATLNYLGFWAPVLFIIFAAMQVILMIWPAPMELVGGYVFGPAWGLVYSALGIAVGSMVAFLLGRWLERRYISRQVGPENMKLVRNLMKREGALAAFLIFLLPGIPKDFLCYMFGMTRVPLAFFLAVTTLARLPGTFLFAFQGAELYAGHYGVILVLLAMYAGVAFWLYRRRQAVYRWLDRWHPEEE
jgi:uncharacterized membrane protein YdjX (TVP38/TMEM64 family)